VNRVFRALVTGLLLASVGATSALAETEFCVAVADDQTACPRVPEPDLTAIPVEQDLAATPAEEALPELAPAQLAPADEPAISTRTLGPPVVVHPFAGTAAPAAAQTEDIALPRARPAEPQKLPPGPPSRFP
jgi:hypothetical protein